MPLLVLVGWISNICCPVEKEIKFWEKKEKSLEKFYHIFNTLDNRKAFNLNVHETRVAVNDRVKSQNFFKQN